MEAEARLKQMASCEDEVEKFEDELTRLDEWMTEAEDTLRSTQRTGGDLARLTPLRDQHKVHPSVLPCKAKRQ